MKKYDRNRAICKIKMQSVCLSLSVQWQAHNHSVIHAKSRQPNWCCQRHNGQHWVTTSSLLSNNLLDVIFLHHCSLLRLQLQLFWQCYFACSSVECSELTFSYLLHLHIDYIMCYITNISQRWTLSLLCWSTGLETVISRRRWFLLVTVATTHHKQNKRLDLKWDRANPCHCTQIYNSLTLLWQMVDNQRRQE